MLNENCVKRVLLIYLHVFIPGEIARGTNQCTHDLLSARFTIGLGAHCDMCQANHLLATILLFLSETEKKNSI